MLKMKVILFCGLFISFSALAQVDEASPEVNTEKPQFAEFLMRGWSVGFEYALMDANVQIKFKDGSKWTGHTTESAGALGVSVIYGQLRRSDFGLLFGGSLIRKLESNKETNAATLKAGIELTQLRPEMSAAYSLSNGLYGFAGAHISLLSIDTDSLDKGGFGVQLGAGYIPDRNWGVDVGYFFSMHNVKESAVTVPIEKSESYYMFKQLRLRVSYMF